MIGHIIITKYVNKLNDKNKENHSSKQHNCMHELCMYVFLLKKINTITNICLFTSIIIIINPIAY